MKCESPNFFFFFIVLPVLGHLKFTWIWGLAFKKVILSLCLPNPVSELYVSVAFFPPWMGCMHPCFLVFFVIFCWKLNILDIVTVTQEIRFSTLPRNCYCCLMKAAVVCLMSFHAILQRLFFIMCVHWSIVLLSLGSASDVTEISLHVSLSFHQAFFWMLCKYSTTFLSSKTVNSIK